MILKGKLYAETPIFRGNARNTLFTRDGDGTHRLVSLAGEITGTAQSLMDAFVGESGNGKNIGLLNRMWQRLYDSPLPNNLITSVDCKLQKESYPRNNFFDMRMGIKLDEDRWAAEANANYKMETVLRNSVFDIIISVKESILQRDENEARLYYLLQEIKEGRFWFGAGKSKGLGRVRLEMNLPFSVPESPPRLRTGANHLRMDLTFSTTNPVLVGWNWGKVDPQTETFSSIEAHLLIEAMKNIPKPIRDRLEMALGGPILSPDDWKQKFASYLPRIISIWLKERSSAEVETWVLLSSGMAKLKKGKHALTEKLLSKIKPLVDKPFPSQNAADAAFKEALGKKANMAKRVVKVIEHQRQIQQHLDKDAWLQVADSLGLDKTLAERLADKAQDETSMAKILTPACLEILPRLYQQVDQQVKLLQSDAWVDAEVMNREEHLRIKTMLLGGKISEDQWNDPAIPPEGVSPATWAEFIDAHSRVKYRHMLNTKNLNKSITNDKNQIEFLKSYRDQTRQELAQPHHIDFRAGGVSSREVSREYGKPYDTVFMRMLSWVPSSQEKGSWETYVPGSTIKGAFRKRASQTLKTLWGESDKTTRILTRIFGAQGQRALVFFSDAYLVDPSNPKSSWCSMDGIKMDPKTGLPIETAKRDYLFAYGDNLSFYLQIDIQDIEQQDIEAVSLLLHLLQDFQRGDVPLGGAKTSGFGWVEAKVSKLTWLTGDSMSVHQKLFGEQSLSQKGLWQGLELEGEKAESLLRPSCPFLSERGADLPPPTARAGFISHRAFGGLCGTLAVEAEVLTPINIRQSGEPSFKATLDDGPVNGWDFFSLAPPEAEQRGSNLVYALPSRSIKGMLRHIYSIVSDSRVESGDISRLSPSDSLFGWVGTGHNQAIMGRVSFSFGIFEEPDLAWFEVPYPYGDWQYVGGQWKNIPGASVPRYLIDNNWRLFPHAPLAPIARRLDGFEADTVKARYFRAILPGTRSRFTIRFWNLLEDELQKLLWCVVLEPGLALKMGNNRYLGFGSLRFRILPDSFMIDWNKRYSGGSEEDWRLPLDVDKWLNPNAIKHYTELQKALNAKHL